MVPTRVRIRFSKQGDLRLVSHHDLMRLLVRMFRRADVAISPSEGFRPKPRMMLPSALALGVAGRDEVLDVDLVDPPPAALLAMLTAEAPEGMTLHAAEVIPPGTKKAQIASLTYEQPVPAECRAQLAARVSDLLASSTCLVAREGREQPVELRSHILELALDGDVLRMRLAASHEAGARPRDVLVALGLQDLAGNPWQLVRTAVELRPLTPCQPETHSPAAHMPIQKADA